MAKIKSKSKSKKDLPTIKFPLNILKPVADFLTGEAKKLEKRKQSLAKEDPFADTSRVTDNASPDMEASEQVGHTRVESLKQHTEKRLIQIRKALTRLKLGKYGTCEKCGAMIDTDRLVVMPEATLCVKCGKDKER